MSSTAPSVTAGISPPRSASLAELVSRYQELIQKAALAGQTNTVEALVQEMNHAIASWSTDQLMTGLQAQKQVAASEKAGAAAERFYDPSSCSIDLEKLVYDGDRNTVKAMLLDPELAGILEQIQTSSETPFNVRSDLLKKALHVTPRLAPQLHEILETCRARLGMKRAVEIFIDPSNELNAFVITPEKDGKVLVILTSALVESFSPPELSFVVGHELGHHLFEHRRLPVHKILEHHGDALTPLQRMRLFAWKRAAEISADRVGILCAQSYEAALSALFKISSGISSALGGFDLTEYSKQLGELQNEIGNAEVDPSDWYTTHPFNPVRIRAAEFFWKSETYQELSGIQSHSIEFSEAALETSIAELLRIMEPAALSAGGEAGPILGTFFFWAALDLVLADEQVDEREVEALSTMVSPTPSAEVIAEFRSLTAEARWDRVVEWGQQASVHLSPKLRLAVIRDLSVLASSDGKLDEMELKTLRAHCRGLGVTEDFLITVLEELKKDLD